MNNDAKNPNVTAPIEGSGRHAGESQDAIRHQKDALHHKFHKNPVDGKTAQQRDSDSGQQIEEQPEIPKVGSRDAPGG
jgi:hypothetical protein